MKTIKSLLISLMALSLSAPVFAYIDPGSGSAIMSAVIGFFVAISLAIKTYWYKIKSFFSSSESADAAPARNEDKDSDQ